MKPRKLNLGPRCKHRERECGGVSSTEGVGKGDPAEGETEGVESPAPVTRLSSTRSEFHMLEIRK